MSEANKQADRRRCENKQCPSQYGYYEGDACPTCNQALVGDREPAVSKTPEPSTLASATGSASGFWRSARGENHGLNSKPGDVWVNPGDITDTDRLNWLEKCLESHIIGRDSIEGDWFITLPHVAIVASKEKTLREAIDVAMTPNSKADASRTHDEQ